jgi:cyclopropane fatty-acyl-phospholipid synthase-like methyltransferase
VIYASVPGQRSMALDTVRNDAYGAALRQVVTPDSVVLDLGAGSGIHGLIAARLGAKRVYLVEPEDILTVAGEIARANGLADRVRCVPGRFEDIQLPEPVDIIVSALTGNLLLAEDLLPTLFRARDAVLKPGGVLIPSAATMEAAPVSAPDLHAKEIANWSHPQQGVDLGAARPYAANSIFFRGDELRSVVHLAEPAPLCTIDFHQAREARVHAAVTCEITSSGVCHGWVGWFAMKLGARWLSTSPREAPLHWSAAYLPLDPPLPVERGDQVSFTLDRPPLGDWTWRVRTAAADQRHSTLLAAPLSEALLAKAALDYAPSLGASGLALRHVLEQCGGSATVASIARSLADRYPERYAALSDAVEFVQQIVKRYG